MSVREDEGRCRLTDPGEAMFGKRNPDWKLSPRDREVGLEGVARVRALLGSKDGRTSYPVNSQAIQCEHRTVRDGECMICHTPMEPT